MNKTLNLLIFFSVVHFTVLGKDYILLSPDKKNKVNVVVNENVAWSLYRGKEMLIRPSNMSLTLGNGTTLGSFPKVRKSSTGYINGTINAEVPVRNKVINNSYNELKLEMDGGYSLEFRAYNEGVAYRFKTSLGVKPIEVNNEKVEFNFNSNCDIYLPKEEDPEFQSHYEGYFSCMKLVEVSQKTYGYLPLYLSAPSGTKMVITESDLSDYPNFFLFGTNANTLVAQFPKVILKSKIKNGSDRAEQIIQKANYHAKTPGNRSFPWRVVMISPDDKSLLENEMVYKLAQPNVLENTDWIKPGKVSWDWWNDNNIYGVNFKSGINTETYKYYVDFASEYGLEYIILDEGWSRTTTDLTASNSQLDLKELIKYANLKKVGVILWALWKPLDENMDKILDQYAAWGVKGVKVDFMARADQYMVNFYERTANAAAKRKLIVDFHGAYKPVGLNRKYPNVLNYEGVRGMEQNKWDNGITPVHNTTLPFTRMAAGPMDFTPGAMLNTNKNEFYINWSSPMSRGTRAQQASMYIIYDSPLQMLCDNPSNYRNDPTYTRYISKLPTVWDKTIALQGKIGEYVLVARQHGDRWYIGGMTNWDARSFKVPLTFLNGKNYKVEILKDGVNVKGHAADYQIISTEIASADTLSVDMAAGGGYVAILSPI